MVNETQKAKQRNAASIVKRVSLMVAALTAVMAPGVGRAQIQRTIVNPSFEEPSIRVGTSSSNLGCQGYVYASRVPGWLTTDPIISQSTAGFDSPNGCVGTNPTGSTRVFEYYSNWVSDNQTGIEFLASNGSQFVELQAEAPSRLYQNVCLVPGEIVNYSFSHLGRLSATVADVANFMVGGTGRGTGRVVMTARDSNDGSPGSVGQGLSTNATRVTGASASPNSARNWGFYSGSFVVPADLGGVQQIGFDAVSSANSRNQSVNNTPYGNFLDNVTITMKPTIELNATSYTVTEGVAGAPTITVVVAGDVPSGGIPVTLTITPGTATIGTDYTVNGGTNLTFTATIPAGSYGGGTVVAVPLSALAVVNDRVVEAMENFTVTVQPNFNEYVLSSTTSCNATGRSTATINIRDNDGTIRVTKDAVPNDAQDFAFTTTGADFTAFSLDDDSNATLPNSRDFVLNAGNYSVTETATSGWVLTNLVCTDPDSGTTVNLATALATIDLDAGETVACTYTNDKIQPLTVNKTSAAYWDPVNGTTNPKMIPGGIVTYTISVSNPGNLPTTADSIIAMDPLPALVSMIVGDIGGSGSGPIGFNPVTSGLSYTFSALSNMSDDLDFSSDGGATWNRVPSPGPNNADATVTHFRIRPKGVMAAGSTFSFIFRALIK